MSVLTPANFNVQAQIHIDTRLTQADITARDNIATPVRYWGMFVHVLDSDGSNNPNTYILQKGTTSIDIFDDGNWIPVFSAFVLTDGAGTTANGTAIDLNTGGTSGGTLLELKDSAGSFGVDSEDVVTALSQGAISGTSIETKANAGVLGVDSEDVVTALSSASPLSGTLIETKSGAGQLGVDGDDIISELSSNFGLSGSMVQLKDDSGILGTDTEDLIAGLKSGDTVGVLIPIVDDAGQLGIDTDDLPATGSAGNATEIQIGDGAGGFTASANLTAVVSTGRTVHKNGTKRTNYNADGISVSDTTGTTTLIEFFADSDTNQVLAMGDFVAPKIFLSTVASQFGFDNSWIAPGHVLGIGTDTPDALVALDIGGTAGVKVPVGTSAQGVAVLGNVRFNSTNNQFEVRGSLLNQSSSYSRIGEHPYEMTIVGEGTIPQSSSSSQSFNLSPFKSGDGAIEWRVKFIAYDSTNVLAFSGEYVALYKDVTATATQISTTQTIYEITDDAGNPPVVTLDIDTGSARITIDFANTVTPTRSYAFHYEGIFRYNKIKASA